MLWWKRYVMLDAETPGGAEQALFLEEGATCETGLELPGQGSQVGPHRVSKLI
eukprot:SAG11_NODE_1498_length_4791_cov_3.641517_2_plen_53_part_00